MLLVALTSLALRPPPHPGAGSSGGMPTFLPFVIAASVLLPLLITAAILIPILKKAARNKKLLQTGVQADGRILSVRETGVKVNGRPGVRIELEVSPRGGAPFNATAEKYVSFLEIPRLQPGSVVTVRFDPANPTVVAIESFG